MALPLEGNINYLHCWIKKTLKTGSLDLSVTPCHPNSQAVSCHPIYDDHVMYLNLKHAIYSATLQTDATAISCSYQAGEVE
eukprot:1157264-Pelagomonas_calceolata.AAC.8